MICSVIDCNEFVKYKGLCGKHYKRQWRHGNPNVTLIKMHEGSLCEVLECSRVASKCGLCTLHYTRKLRYGRLVNIKAPHNMGRPQTRAGYVLLTKSGRRIYEHLYLAEKALGKPLPPKAVVHHINGIPWDNRPSNLIICPDQSYHFLLHRRTRKLKREE